MLLEFFFSVFLFFVIRANSQCTVCPIKCEPVVWFYYSSSEPNPCGTFNQSSLISNFEKPTPDCYGHVFPMFCAGFQKISDYNQQNNCSIPSGQMCSTWCNQMEACLQAPLLHCSDPSQWAQPGSPCVNVTPDDVIIAQAPYTPTYLPYCPTVLDKQGDPQLIIQQELGPLATIYKDPGFPQIPQVYLPHKSFADLFAPKCSEFHGSVQRESYVGFFIFMLIFVPTTVALFIWRRHRWPIRSREPFLVATFVFFNFILYLMFAEYEIFGTTAQCDILYVVAVIGGPLYFAPLVLRALRLVFFYRWNLSKVKNHGKDWYFDHRWLVSTKIMASVLVINAVICSLMAVMVMEVSGEWAHGTVLATGRCNWWYFSPEIVSYVQNNYNLTLQDNLLNMYGIGPYSVAFESCLFCRMKDGLVWFILAWNLIFVFLLVACTYILRNINDQYWLWREFMISSIANVFCFPLVIAAVTPQGGKAFGVYDGQTNDFIGIIVGFVVLWNHICVIVLPLVLTFTRAAKEKEVLSEKEKSTIGSRSQPFFTVDRKQQEKDKLFSLLEVDKDGSIRVSIDVEDVLSDPVGEQCLRNFAVELFKAELVEFFIQARAYHELNDREQMRIMASKLYYTYIAAGSPLQINISHKTREKYDRLARDGVFDESQMTEQQDDSNVFTGYKKAPSSTSPTTESLRLVIPKPSIEAERADGDKSEPLEDRSISPSLSIAALTRDVSEAQASVTFEDNKSSLTIDGKSTISEESISSKFQAVDFHQPQKEVKNLLRDDWSRFQQSNHWTIFRDHLVKMAQAREHSPMPDYDERRHSTYAPVELSSTESEPNGTSPPRTPRKPTTPRGDRGRSPTTPPSTNNHPDAA